MFVPHHYAPKRKILNASGRSGDGGCVMGVDDVAAGPDGCNRWSGMPVPNLPDSRNLLKIMK